MLEITKLNTSPSLVVLVAISLFFSGCDDSYSLQLSNNHNSIVNGTETDFDIWKGVVAVVTIEGGQVAGICTGALIHPEIVLTAGHCVKLEDTSFGQEPYDYTNDPSKLAVMGGANLNNESQSFMISGVESVIAHETWQGVLDPYNAVDLSILHLSEPVYDLGFYCVREDLNIGNDDDGVIVGYGLSSTWEFNSSGIHRWGETTLLTVGPQVIEIGDPTGTCQGDSGGPLFTEVEDGRWEITGTTSFGEEWICDDAGGGWSVSTLVYYDWIDEQVQTLTGDSLDGCTNCGPDGFECEEADEITGGDGDGDGDTDSETEADGGADSDADGDSDDEGSSASGGCGCDVLNNSAEPNLLEIVSSLI